MQMIFFALVTAVSAQAQAASDTPDRPVWSAGAGIGATLGGLGVGGSLSGIIATPPGPAVSLLVERSLSPNWSLMLQGRGSYSSDKPEPTDTPAGRLQPTQRRGNASLTTGARWIPSPDALVIVSPALLVGGTYDVQVTESELVGGPEIPTSATRGWAFLGAFALILERELVPSLHVRFQAVLAQFRSGEVEREFPDPNNVGAKMKRTSKTTNIEAGFVPSLELRMSF